MAIVYVSRDGLGRISGVFANAQHGYADLAAVQAELGLPAGQGQQAFDLINGARLALDDGRITALREIDQG